MPANPYWWRALGICAEAFWVEVVSAMRLDYRKDIQYLKSAKDNSVKFVCMDAWLKLYWDRLPYRVSHKIPFSIMLWKLFDFNYLHPGLFTKYLFSLCCRSYLILFIYSPKLFWIRHIFTWSWSWVSICRTRQHGILMMFRAI